MSSKRPARRSLDPAWMPTKRPGWKRRRPRRSVPVRVLGGLAVLAGLSLAVGLWRRYRLPIRQRTRFVRRLSGRPDSLPPDAPGAEQPTQRMEEGTGAAFHRRYRVEMETALSPEALIARLAADPDACSPPEIARFEKTTGAEGRLAVGDEFFIHITGPWNGPVRVTRVAPTSFTFATLDGHLEAGQIRFSAERHPGRPGALRFTIESWARSRDRLVDLAYDTLGVAKAAQHTMWALFCEQVVALGEGERLGEITVVTERAPDPDADESPQEEAQADGA